MKLQRRSSAFGNPIVASAEVIVTIRRLVQNACEHNNVRPNDSDGLRMECADCGFQTRAVAVEQLVRSSRSSR